LQVSRSKTAVHGEGNKPRWCLDSRANQGTVRVPATDGADFQSKGRHVGTDPRLVWESCDLCHREDPAPEVVQDGARPARGQGVIAAWDTDPEVQWTGF